MQGTSSGYVQVNCHNKVRILVYIAPHAGSRKTKRFDNPIYEGPIYETLYQTPHNNIPTGQRMEDGVIDKKGAGMEQILRERERERNGEGEDEKEGVYVTMRSPTGISLTPYCEGRAI